MIRLETAGRDTRTVIETRSVIDGPQTYAARVVSRHKLRRNQINRTPAQDRVQRSDLSGWVHSCISGTS